MAYSEYIDSRTNAQMTELIHKLMEQRQSRGLSQQNIADAVGMELSIDIVPIAKKEIKE